MAWSELEQKLIGLVNSLSLFPTVIVQVVMTYAAPVPWRGQMVHQWLLNNKTAALVSDGKSLYVCNGGGHALHKYNLETRLLEDTWSSPQFRFVYPQGIGLSGDELYVLDAEQVQVFSTANKTLIRHWPIVSSTSCRRVFLKLSNNDVFVTVSRVHRIFVYNRFGILQRKYGKKLAGSAKGKFNCPHGMAVDTKYLYVCDRDNHRVQVLDKATGTYSHQWGTKGTNDGHFIYPYSIALTEGEEGEQVVYVGDETRVQVFSIEGNFQRRLLGRNTYGEEIGEFNCISGLLMIENYLYLSDCNNNRIQVWH